MLGVSLPCQSTDVVEAIMLLNILLYIQHNYDNRVWGDHGGMVCNGRYIRIGIEALVTL